METSTGRSPSPRYSSTAAPPSTVKIGAPSTAAASTSEISGHRGASARMPADRPSQSPARMPSPAAARPAHAGDARQTSRPAMTANATGRTSCAIQTGTPAATNVAVASAISLPLRAAIAAPRKPTQSVKCWTNGIEPGMPPATTGRTTISASGSSTIAASAKLATACSAPPRARTIRARTPAAEALSPMRISGRPPRQRPARKLSRARTARS